MGRKLMRVPLDFQWPLNKRWIGYTNPYVQLMANCPDCRHGGSWSSGLSPEAYLFHQQWYGYVEFDPVEYGSEPITIDHPLIREFAERQVSRDPSSYMTSAEIRQATISGSDDLSSIMAHREPAIRREVERLYNICIKNHWCHHLNQADVDALVADGRLKDFTHRPIDEEQVALLRAQEADGGSGYWLKEPNGYHPTAKEVNDWALFGLGHDSLNQWVCLRARCLREGVPMECSRCSGEGSLWEDVSRAELVALTDGMVTSEQALAWPNTDIVAGSAIKTLYEEWIPSDPPDGPGYQLWETTSEGSPISPVFETLDALCEWAENNSTTFGNFRATKSEWISMLDADFVRHEVVMPNGDSAVFM